MLRPTIFTAAIVLLFPFIVSVPAHAGWSKGLTVTDSAFSMTSGTGQMNSNTPAGDLKVSAVYYDGARQGANDANGGGDVYQTYIWSGSAPHTTLNFKVNYGASGSGAGSHQATSDVHSNGHDSSQIGQGGSTDVSGSYSYPASATQYTFTDAASSGSNRGQINAVNSNEYDFYSNLSADARLQGTGSSSQAEAVVSFGDPYFLM